MFGVPLAPAAASEGEKERPPKAMAGGKPTKQARERSEWAARVPDTAVVLTILIRSATEASRTNDERRTSWVQPQPLLYDARQQRQQHKDDANKQNNKNMDQSKATKNRTDSNKPPPPTATKRKNRNISTTVKQQINEHEQQSTKNDNNTNTTNNRNKEQERKQQRTRTRKKQGTTKNIKHKPILAWMVLMYSSRCEVGTNLKFTVCAGIQTVQDPMTAVARSFLIFFWMSSNDLPSANPR